VFEDVAMERPIAGIVGDEGDVHHFLGRDQDGVLDLRLREGNAFAGQNVEGMAVQWYAWSRWRSRNSGEKRSSNRICSSMSSILLPDTCFSSLGRR